jgi:hypothetical protein
MNAGIPQGSKISPILFNLYIWDFPTSTNTEIALYADDSVIYSSSDKIENVIVNIQSHFDEIQKWAQKWKIILNPTKSTAVIFTYFLFSFLFCQENFVNKKKNNKKNVIFSGKKQNLSLNIVSIPSDCTNNNSGTKNRRILQGCRIRHLSFQVKTTHTNIW